MEELERGERLVEGRQLLSPIPLLAAISAFLMVAAAGPSPLSVTAAVVTLLACAAWTAWTARHVSITDRRIVEYRVALARLARRFPRLARAEVERRRVINLEEVAGARRSGVVIHLRTRTGATHELDCHDEVAAVHLLNAIDDFLRKSPHLRPIRRPIEPKVNISISASDESSRCPYCHDAVPAEEAAGCERCGAVHHAECMAVHGGCAAFGCIGEKRARVRS